MKNILIKISVAVFALAIAFVIGACSASVAKAEQVNPIKIWFQNKNGYNETYLIVDEETGVNYIGFGGYSCETGKAITPRLNADGTVYVSK